MSRIPTIKILDIPLFNGGITDFYKIMLDDISTGNRINRQISFCDANVLVSTKKDQKLKSILTAHTYINMADGVPGVWIGKLKGAKSIKRCYGPDMFDYLVRKTSGDNELKHFFSGGRQGVANKLKKHCEDIFKNHNIIGTHCPPFRDLSEGEIQSIAKEINSKNTDIVWIGISSPKQDLYAKRLCKYLNVHFIFTVGAAFDFFTGNVRQAPKYIQKSGFEWLFRLLMEPKRLWKRYFKVIPLFVIYNLKSLIK